MQNQKIKNGRGQVLTGRELKNGYVKQADFEKCLALRLNITVKDAHEFTHAFIAELKQFLLEGFSVKFPTFGIITTKMHQGKTKYNNILDRVVTEKSRRVVKISQSGTFTEELTANYRNLLEEYKQEREQGE